MSRLYEIVLVNAGLATILAIVAEATGRWLHRPALAHCVWVLVLLKLLTPPVWTFDVRLPAVTTSKPGLMSNQAGSPLPASRLAIDSPPGDVPTVPAINALAQVDHAENACDSQSTNWLRLVTWIWLSGTLTIIAVVGYRAWQFWRVVPGTFLAGENIRAMVAQLAEEIGVRPPSVRLTSGAISPMIWSLGGRAQLLLPVALTAQLSPSELKTLLIHELAHIRRKDHWVRWIEIVAMAVCWWHPVTWLARLRIEELEEECCDAWVLATLGDAGPTYARALLTTVEYVSGVQPVLPPLASGLGYVKFLKRRLTMILHGPRNHRLSQPLWAAALGLAVLILPLSGKVLPASRAADDDEPAKAEPGARDGKSEDLDRRLRALETRMDRVLGSLERNASSENARVQDAEKRLEEAKRRIAQERERVGQALRHKEEMIRERRRSSDTKKDLDQLTEDLQKQIESAVHQAIDPKRLEQMEQQIEQAVHEQLGSERMAAMGKQIEETVNRALSPEKIEAMQRQIEDAINRSLKLEKSDRVRRDRTRERETRVADAGQSSDSKRNTDLERRVERLEVKMDRLLDAVEKSQKR